VRSRWEADVCRVFIYNNCVYDYESYTILLKDRKSTISWIVDFVDPHHLLSDDGLIEVKGWWDKKSKKKLRLLKKQRLNIYRKITFIGRKKIIELRDEYSSLIPEWESYR